MKIARLILFFLAFVTAVAAQSHFVLIKTDDYPAIRFYLEKKGYDVAGYDDARHELGIVTSDPKSFENLELPAPLHFTIVSVMPGSSYLEYSPKREGIDDYYNVEETLQEMEKLERTYPKWAKLFNLCEFLGLPATHEGKYVYALQVSGNPDMIEDEPKAMIVGVHHAREITTHHAVLDAAKDLLVQASSGNPRYLDWIQRSAVWFVPVVNPDGMSYVFSSNRMWRKNLSRNADGTRGVDLNRNYAFKWGECGSNSSTPGSDIYKGPSAQSEPEVRIMNALNARLRCQFLISYHSYGNEVLYPYVCGDLAESSLYYAIRDALTKETGYGKRYASSSGEDFEQHYNYYGTISFLLEIGTSFQPSFSTYQGTIWPAVKKVLPFVMDRMHGAHIHLRVMDAATGELLPASVSVKQVQFKQGEKRSADGHGSYRWYLSPGEYTVTVSMPGYRSHVLTTTLGTQVVEQWVQLEKN